MKKLFLMLLAIGIIISGCSHKGVVKPVEQQKQEIPAAEQRKSEKMQTEKQKPVPAEKVTSSDTAADLASKNSRVVQELQAKLQDIHFDYDKYVVRADGKPALKMVSDILLKNKNLKVTIEGHCDERGTNEYNLALGDKRASAVKELLTSMGIPSSRIETISYGEEKPVCTESTESCWAKNRRAHFALEEAKR